MAERPAKIQRDADVPPSQSVLGKHPREEHEMMRTQSSEPLSKAQKCTRFEDARTSQNRNTTVFISDVQLSKENDKLKVEIVELQNAVKALAQQKAGLQMMFDQKEQLARESMSKSVDEFQEILQRMEQNIRSQVEQKEKITRQREELQSKYDSLLTEYNNLKENAVPNQNQRKGSEWDPIPVISSSSNIVIFGQIPTVSRFASTIPLLPHYLSQSVLRCKEVEMIVENIADKKAVATVVLEKGILDKGLTMEDLNERCRYFESLLSGLPELEEKILYFLGNSFYEKGEYEEAADLYVRSLNAPSNRFQSTETVSMLMEVAPAKVSDEKLKICWQHSQTKQMRLEWLKSSDVKSEMVGAAKCCGHLSERWRNLHDEQRWNDESLLWLKRSLNIMEMIDVIIIIHCKAGDTVDSKIPQVMMEDDKSTDEIPRKRLSAGYDPSLYVRGAQNFLQLYLGCLVERFRGETYRMDTDINLQDTQYRDTFWNFHANQGRFNGDFEEYLRFELDSVFEILHWHFKDNGDEPNQWIHCDRPDIADVYVNYASYLTDVQGLHQAARDLYDIALEHSPNDPVVHWNIAELCEKTGRQKEAVKEFNEAIRLARFYWRGQERDSFIRDARKQIDDINKKKRKRRQ